MKLFPILLVLCAAAWVSSSCYRQRRVSGVWWKMTFGFLILAGLTGGTDLITRTHYKSPELKVTGFPFTIGAAEFRDGRWLGGLIAQHHRLSGVADIALALLIVLAPFRALQWVAQRFGRTCPGPPGASVPCEALL